jgi:ATPase family associated with various cellular activities (AAA)
VSGSSWIEANQRYLAASLGVVRARLQRHADGDTEPLEPHEAELENSAAALPAPSALDRLVHGFSLSPFERDVLLLCAGVELDSAFLACCARAHEGEPRPYPTFSLALSALPAAHWSALTPEAPLRRWRLIEVGAGETLTTSPLRIDERVLHHLTGVAYVDERLQGLVETVEDEHELPPSWTSLAEQIGAWWTAEPAVTPAVQLTGPDPDAVRSIVAGSARQLGLRAFALRGTCMPSTPAERDAFARLWDREAALSGSVLVVEIEGSDGNETRRAALHLIERSQSPMVFAAREPLEIRSRPSVRLALPGATATERRSLWRATLGELAEGLNGALDATALQFDLGPRGMAAVCARLRRSPSSDGKLADELWEACRAEARIRFDQLAERIEPAARWDDLVIPEPQRETLREIAILVRHRSTVYEGWGFRSKSTRGLGITALFAGASGTGKTMAAEVLARELRLDLFRIDLSQVVSKYIGETEKNLRRVFDAAEAGGAIPLFDEADALFGKRPGAESRDSHARYAAIEVGYLLQRMEAYRGLAILTTNRREAVDEAFLRRIRFVIQFPFPDQALRAEIWRHIFPERTPTDGLSEDQLARLRVPGGNIRNIALGASFLAASQDEPVRMRHVLSAARREYAKLDRTLTAAEIGSWR